MLKFQFSTRHLMVATLVVCLLVVAVTAFGLGALSVVFYLLVRFSLLAAILGFIFPLDQTRRAFWTGYVVFGWGSFFLAQQSLNLHYFGLWFHGLGLLALAILGGVCAVMLQQNAQKRNGVRKGNASLQHTAAFARDSDGSVCGKN